jgi:hypothetical protein
MLFSGAQAAERGAVGPWRTLVFPGKAATTLDSFPMLRGGTPFPLRLNEARQRKRAL